MLTFHWLWLAALLLTAFFAGLWSGWRKATLILNEMHDDISRELGKLDLASLEMYAVAAARVAQRYARELRD